jgi:uncharacterized protein
MSLEQDPILPSGEAGEQHAGDVPALTMPAAAPPAVPEPLHGLTSIHPVLFAFILLGVVFFAYQVIGGVIAYLLFGMTPKGGAIQGMRLVTLLSQVAFLMLPALLAVRAYRGGVRAALRLRSAPLRQALPVLISMPALAVVMDGYVTLQDAALRTLLPSFAISLLEKFGELIDGVYRTLLGMHSPLEFAWVWLVVAATPAICEEVLFRGAVQDLLGGAMSRRWTLVLTGVIFAAFHLNPVSFVPLAALGIYFAFLVDRSGSLLLPMIAHVTNNTIAVISLYFFRSDTILPAAGHGDAVTAGTVAGVAAGGAVFAACLIWFLRETRVTEHIPT